MTTKLHIPRRRSNLVPRPRLTEHLTAGLERKLTLISAPAGYGKTTLLSEWIPHSRCCVAWVSLDEGDNDPARFWACFIAALQTLHPSIGQQAALLLQSAQQVPGESFVTTLANEIGAFRDDFALVLDDYHAIQTQSIHQALALFLDHLCPHMHLVIATRSDPMLPLSRLRALDELTELRAQELCFVSDETSSFLNDTMHLNLSTADVAALEARTEGWIAGLQLAALSLRGREHPSDFVAAFTGSHRFILDYLSDQVLELQLPELQLFLLQTSILNRLNAPLCDALTGRHDSQSVLEMLEQHNLFLVPLDDERRWYRYHRLFADVLRQRLWQTQPEMLPTLHCRASDWYASQGLISEAVSHALAASDFERAAQRIEQGIERLWPRGELLTLASWMQALPDGVRHSRPGLCLAYARVLADTGQYAAEEALVADAERELEGHRPADNGAAASLQGKALALRAQLAATRSEFAQAIELSQQAGRLLPDGDVAWRSYVAAQQPGALGLAILDLARMKQAGNVPLDKAPRALNFSPDGKLLYFTLAGVDAVQVLDPASNKVTAQIPVGASPHHPLFTPNGRYGLVVAQGPGELDILNPAANSLTKAVAVGKMPHWIALDPKGETAYVTNEASNDVSVVDLASGKVTATIPIGNAPRKIVVQPLPAAASAAPGPAGVQATISGFAFAPTRITVSAGQAITWTNSDSVPHTVTSDNGLFDSGDIAAGASYSLTLSKPGSYGYHCMHHPYMTGTIVVTS